MKTVFETDRIRFVEVCEELVPDYQIMINDVEHVQKLIRRTYEPRAPYTEEEELVWVRKKREQKADAFSMVEKRSGRFIGNCELMHTDGDERELGIALTAAMQDRGYGTEAVSALLRYGWNVLGLKRIVLHANPDNLRAVHVYEKCGFRTFERTDGHVAMEAFPPEG